MQEHPAARGIVRRLSALREESSVQEPAASSATRRAAGVLPAAFLPRLRRRRPNRPHNSNDVKVELQWTRRRRRKSAVWASTTSTSRWLQMPLTAKLEVQVVGLDDFVVEAVLGSGMFATVALVSDKDSGEQFALKSLNKRAGGGAYQVKAAKAARSSREHAPLPRAAPLRLRVRALPPLCPRRQPVATSTTAWRRRAPSRCRARGCTPLSSRSRSATSTTRSASSTATSSPTTCCSTRKATRCSPILDCRSRRTPR